MWGQPPQPALSGVEGAVLLSNPSKQPNLLSSWAAAFVRRRTSAGCWYCQ